VKTSKERFENTGIEDLSDVVVSQGVSAVLKTLEESWHRGSTDVLISSQ
jgi:hypothetical protein